MRRGQDRLRKLRPGHCRRVNAGRADSTGVELHCRWGRHNEPRPAGGPPGRDQTRCGWRTYLGPMLPGIGPVALVEVERLAVAGLVGIDDLADEDRVVAKLERTPGACSRDTPAQRSAPLRPGQPPSRSAQGGDFSLTTTRRNTFSKTLSYSFSGSGSTRALTSSSVTTARKAGVSSSRALPSRAPPALVSL
jgi:hypothetical protein